MFIYKIIRVEAKFNIDHDNVFPIFLFIINGKSLNSDLLNLIGCKFPILLSADSIWTR